MNAARLDYVMSLRKLHFLAKMSLFFPSFVFPLRQWKRLRVIYRYVSQVQGMSIIVSIQYVNVSDL